MRSNDLAPTPTPSHFPSSFLSLPVSRRSTLQTEGGKGAGKDPKIVTLSLVFIQYSLISALSSYFYKNLSSDTFIDDFLKTFLWTSKKSKRKLDEATWRMIQFYVFLRLLYRYNKTHPKFIFSFTHRLNH